MDQLETWEAGAVLGALMLGDGTALRHLSSHRPDAVYRALGELARPQRMAAVAELGRRVASPSPRWLARVDPAELERVLAGQPAALAAAVVSFLPSELRGQFSHYAGDHAIAPALVVRLVRQVLAPLEGQVSSSTSRES